MQQPFESEHYVDDEGMPAGGYAAAIGVSVGFQSGPLGRDGDRVEPNGAFVETLIAIAKDRIEFYQTASDGRFNCEENARAILHLQAALDTLGERTARREAAGVEGTHAGN